MISPEPFDLAREEAQLQRDLAGGQNPAALAARATTRLIGATLALTAETAASGRTLIQLTRWLIGFTVTIVVLTVALLVLTGVLVWLELSRAGAEPAARALLGAR